jgi:K+-sensing histidine kinase KdpD
MTTSSAAIARRQIDEWIEALDATEPGALAAAVHECTVRLRTGDGISHVFGDALPSRLRAAARHSSPLVRVAVAEAARYMLPRDADPILAALAADRSAKVRAEAVQTARERAEVMRTIEEGEDTPEQEIERMYAKLDKHRGARALAHRIAAAEREHFFRRMYHEGVSPHGRVRSRLEKLEAALAAPDVDRAAAREAIEEVRESAATIWGLIEEARRTVLAIEPRYRQERLRSLVDETAAKVRRAFPEHGSRLIIDTRRVDRRLVLELDAMQLKDGLFEILKNAVEAHKWGPTPDDPVVVVAARRISAGTRVELTVTDRGHGIGDGEFEQKDIRPFSSGKRRVGLSLFRTRLVAQLVHGGDVTMAKAPGAGAKVTMTLAVKQRAAEGAR